MILQNKITGDVLELPPPNEIGESVVLLNGKVIERVLYSDVDVTLGDGRRFRVGPDFTAHILQLLQPTNKELS